MKINFVIEAPDVPPGALYAPADTFSNWTVGRTVIALNLVLGTVAGNIGTVTMDFTIDDWVELTDADKILGYAVTGSMDPDGRLQVCWT